MGCGVACTASILDKSYSETLTLFKNGEIRAKTVGFSCRSIVDVLKREGLNYKRKSAKDPNETFPPDSIVFIDYSAKYPFGHFFAKASAGWMDPWINIHKHPRVAGFRQELPGKPIYLIYKA